MFQDENEYPKPYTNDYDREESSKTKDAGSYAILDDPTARPSGNYPVPTQQDAAPQAAPVPAQQDYVRAYPTHIQQDYAPQANGNYTTPTQQSYAPPTNGNYTTPTQQGYAPQANNSYSTPTQQGYTPQANGSYSTPTQQGYAPQANGSYPAPTLQGYNSPASSSTPPKKPRGMRTGTMMALTLVIILIFGIGLYAGWQYGNNGGATGSSNAPTSSSSTNINTIPDTSTVQGQQEAAIATIEPSVVELDVTLAQGEAIGSGVIIDKSGDIVTNNHVVNGGQTLKVVLNNGKTETAQLVGTSAENDLAIVHIQPFTGMAVATIGDSSKLVVGQEVLAVGNPLGITQTATRGIVSALNRSIQEPSSTDDPNQAGATINKAIQTDAPINPGNSGGALINLQGELVGIPTLAAINTESNTNANGIGFAIPSSTVQATITQILNQD